MELRYYQRDAIEAVADYIANNIGNPCVEIPTGGGKTPIIATLAGELVRDGYRVLIVAHRKELLEQTRDKLSVWSPNARFGVLSAGLKSKEYKQEVLIAGVQSCYKDGRKISQYGNVDFLIIDECHLIPTTAEQSGGMYRTLIDDLRSCNPDLTVIGFTATPYRMQGGRVCGDKNILTKICYTVSINELIAKRYLSPLISKAPEIDVDFNKIKIERGEFKTADLETAYATQKNVYHAVREFTTLAKNRKSVLVFCCSVRHAEMVKDEIKKISGEEAELITGNTKPELRALYLKRLKGEKVQKDLFGAEEKPLKYLVNVDVLTTGFDATNVDCVVLLRPTQSPGLYYQMVGRGFRIHPNKKDCLVLDYGENIKRHGPVDAIDPDEITTKSKKREPKVRVCPKCFTVVDNNDTFCPLCLFKFEATSNEIFCPQCNEPNKPSYSFCWNCGYEFPIRASNNETAERDVDILQANDDDRRLPEFQEDVAETHYYLHKKRGDPNAAEMLWVQHLTTSRTKVSEFVHFGREKGSFLRNRAIKWWIARSKYIPIPKTAAEAKNLIEQGAIAPTLWITYKPATQKTKYAELVWSEVGELPDITNILPTNPLHLVCDYCENEGVENNMFDFIQDVDSEFGEETPFKAICQNCGGVVKSWTEEQFRNNIYEFERYGITFKKEQAF